MMLSHFEYYNKVSSNNADDLLNSRQWDIFISAHNDNERVQTIYNKVHATRKIWFEFIEYGYDRADSVESVRLNCKSEIEIIDVWNKMSVHKDAKICLDSTGFIAPYLAFLLNLLKRTGYKKIDVIYTEPINYLDQENTIFSIGEGCVRQIEGFAAQGYEGMRDILLINSGFDDKLIRAVAEHKKYSEVHQLVGFPSLRANMYQQGMLRINKAIETIKGNDEKGAPKNTIFAPANDPFITASVIENYINKLDSKEKIRTLYLAPLATKPQLIGMVLFYLLCKTSYKVSLIFPFTDNYSKKTDEGIARIWLYSVMFPTEDELRKNNWIK